MNQSPRTILVSSALPYANGPIHIGHMVEYIQTDIWVRFQRMSGQRVHFVCADDAHGTPIMLKAAEEGMTPEALIASIGEQHRRDFDDFRVDFDNFYTTHSTENRGFAELIYTRLRDAGHITTRSVRQAFDPVKAMFLPDRYVKGTCPNPKCAATEQYGDSCEVCGNTYAPADLIEPRSVLSGEPPQWRDSEHYFFKLADFEPMLRAWVRSCDESGRPRVQTEIANKLDEWFDTGLSDWDISRDAPYFGFEIPDAPGKYFYVWLDAPIGYMASFKNLCARIPELDFDRYWAADSDVELYHFIGKDIAYFHTLFWPAMLSGAGFRVPTGVHCHGFLMVNGQKMSKSRGTFITARTYLEHLDPECLRYYLACKMSAGIDDLDLNLDDFVQRVNSDLVGKVVNIASRCAGFITKRFDGQLADALEAPALQQRLRDAGEQIAELYEQREFSKAMREVMALADAANQYIDERKPWVLAKNADTQHEVQAVCTQGLNLFRILMVYLKPILPRLALDTEAFLQIEPLQLADVGVPLLGHSIGKFKPLLTRVDVQQVELMVAASAAHEGKPAVASTTVAVPGDTNAEEIASTIGIEQFAQIDLRVAEVLSAEPVVGADKLLRIVVDVGAMGQRSIFAGIKSAYDPATLIGRKVVLVANLAPRKMRFGTSEGMLLAAGPGGEDIWLLSADDGATPGMRIK
jgi:methionyl-tRNA synthetase